MLRRSFSRAGILAKSWTRPVKLQLRSLGTMKAMVLTEAHEKNFKMSLEDLKIPEPKAGEVLIKNRACGVCHTDLHVMKKEVGFPIPCVLGHETAGEIVDFGPGTDAVTRERLKVGQKVASPFIMPCGTCHYCVRGKEDLCETFFKFNRLSGTLYDGTTRLYRPDGTKIAMYSMAGLAEYSVVPSTAVYGIPDGVPYVESSIMGCAIFTAYGAMKNAADMRAGETVAVVGTGGVGANCLQIARAFGAEQIIAIDISDDKLKAMKPLGATHTINAKKENVIDRLKEITGGRGVDIAVEALGRPETFKQCVDAVVDGGKAVMVGIAPAGVFAPVEITRLVRRQIKIIGSYGAKARADMPAILRLVQRGFIDVKSPITARYSLKDSAQAYRDLDAHKITGRAIIDMHMK